MKMKSSLKWIGLAATALAINTFADNIVWTDWTSGSAGSPGNAQGFMVVDGQNVTVTYTGELNYLQTNNGDFDWWGPHAASTYTSAGVPNAPDKDLLRLNAGGVINTITFSQ